MKATTPESLVLIIDRERERRTRLTAGARPALHPSLLPARAKSGVHILSLMAVWLTIFSGFFVAFEPAPVDALLIGLVVLLPIVGLARIDTPHLGYLFAWLAITACELVASTMAADVATATIHTVVSLYLSLASFVIAAFIAKRPESHTRLIVWAYVASALVAALMGIVGYLDLIPGASSVFTVHERAAGTFKDPNVYATYLIPAMLFLAHTALSRRFGAMLLSAAAFAVIALALLLSFSRGAWVNLVVAGLVYGWLAFVTARTDRQRLKLVGLAVLSVVLSLGVVAAALEVDAISRLFDQRFALDQSYDEGPEGRFGGQLKAIDQILHNPFGLGPLQFGGVFHPEHPHNVYLSMFLNAGWLGGLIYILLIACLLVAGFKAVMRRKWASPFLLAIYASFVGMVVEGFVIETDHWRHFYLVAGLLAGLAMEPSAVARRMPRIQGQAFAVVPRIALVQPALVPVPVRHVVDLAIALGRAFPRRGTRILGKADTVPMLSLVASQGSARRRRREPKRRARIVGRA